MTYTIVYQHTSYGECRRFFADLNRAVIIYRSLRSSRWVKGEPNLFCQLAHDGPLIPMADI